MTKNSQKIWHYLQKQFYWMVLMALMLTVTGCQSNTTSNGNSQNTKVENDSLISNQTQTDVPSINSSDIELSKTARIHFIDTGNSDAILIEQDGHAALIDGGDNDDETLVVNYIQKLGISSLDYVFATHPDADHIGGLDAVLTDLKVGQVFVGNGKATTKTYTDFINAIMDKGLTPSVPLLGTEIPLGDGVIRVVSVANVKDVNNCSLVLLYTYENEKILLMGDADQSIEKDIDLSLVGDVDLIKVGHHGSKTSSNYDFIKAVSPEYAVITCGAGNKYGHPNQETLTTLEDLDIAIYRTDLSGDIIFELTGNGLLPVQGEESNSSTTEGTTSKPVASDLSGSQSAPSAEEKEEAIETFKPIQESETIVYFTESGKRYHSSSSCSNMKNPMSGTIEEAGNRTPCQKCY